MKRRPAIALAVLCSCILATPGSATTQLEGQYQLQVELRKDLRAFPWDFDSNDGTVFNSVELRLFSRPTTFSEAFLKAEAHWSRGDNFQDRPELQYREGHIGVRKEARGQGISAMLFSRQDRFWVDNYLIRFVDGRGNAQGLRVDSWGFLGMNASVIAADQSDQMDPSSRAADYERNTGYPAPLAPVDSLNHQAMHRTDDLYVVRLRREFFRDRARLGLTWNRTEGWAGRDSISGRTQWQSVLGFDSRVHVRGADVSFEYGQSMPAGPDAENPVISLGGKPAGVRLSDRSVAQAEIRSIRLGTPRLGYFNVTPGWWSRGPLWRNGMGGPNADEQGAIVQSYYLLPERAITYSNQFLWFGSRVQSHRRVQETYHELYVEFLNGFTGKTAYRRRDEYDLRRNHWTRESYLSWFNELQVESRLAWLRVQSKLQNIGRLDHKTLIVIENRLNITDQTKIYTRYALGNDPERLRKGVFVQLQYRPTGSMEMFASYGPDYIGAGSNPVDESNLAGSGDQFDEFRFTLKGTF